MNNFPDSSQRMFLKFMAYYVIVLLLPILLGLFAYYYAFCAFEDEAIKYNLASLEKSMHMVDRRLAEIDSIMEQIAWNTKVREFLSIKEPFKGPNVCRILETRRDLYNYSLTNNFLHSYYVLYKNSDTVLAPDLTYTIPLFYKHFMWYEGKDYDVWYEEVLGQYHRRYFIPETTININGKQEAMITYVQSIGFGKYYLGSIIVLINNNELGKLFDWLDKECGGWVYITDSEGRLITDFAEGNIDIPNLNATGMNGHFTQSIEGQDMLITYVVSKYNGWKYFAVQPMSVVFEKVSQIKKMSFSIIIISLLAGIIASYLLAYKSSNPIRKVLATIINGFNKKFEGRQNPYEVIQNTILQLIENNNALRAALAEQIPFMKAAFFERMLRGDCYDKDNAESIMQYANISLNGSYFRVALIYLCGYNDVSDKKLLEELEKKKLILKDVVARFVLKDFYLHDVNGDRIALIMAYETNDEQKNKAGMKGLINHINKEITDSIGINVIFSIGGIHEGLENIHLSFEEAKQALSYNINNNSQNVFWYSDIPKAKNRYFYPIEVENRLVNSTRAGNKDDVEKILDEIYRKNFVDERLTSNYCRVFLCEMCGSVIKLLQQAQFNNEQIEADVAAIIDSMDSPDETGAVYDTAFKKISEIYYNICDIVDEQKKSHNTKLINEIIEFIRAEYKDPQLSLSLIAEKFKLSDIYLSQFFKQQTGENFSDYLEALRVEQACLLLERTQLPIKDIANQVGYHSSNTFCRVFKRRNNIRATEYRKLVQAQV